MSYYLFYFIVGLAMILYWIAALAMQKVPEMQTDPVELYFHVFAELVTGFVLIIGSISSYRKQTSGRFILSFGFGLLSYTLIMSTGYFIRMHNWEVVFTFVLIILIHIYICFKLIRFKYWH